MTLYDYIILALAFAGIARVHWERRQERIERAVEVARREFGR